MDFEVPPEIGRVLNRANFCSSPSFIHVFLPPTLRNIRDDKGEAIAVQVADYFDETEGRVEYWTFSAIPADKTNELPRP